MSILGYVGALYYNNKWYTDFPDYYTNPQWVEIILARDVSMDGPVEEYEITPRGNQGFSSSVVTLVDMTIEFGMKHERVTDQNYFIISKLMAAWLGGAPLDVCMMEDQFGVSGQVGGIRLPVMISNMRKTEEVEGAQFWDITFRQTLYPDQNLPGFYNP